MASTLSAIGEDDATSSPAVDSAPVSVSRGNADRLKLSWRVTPWTVLCAPAMGLAALGWVVGYGISKIAMNAMGYSVLAGRWWWDKFAPRVDINGCVALVTGGSLGIGEAAAKALAQKGCTVVIWGRDIDNLRRVQLDIRDSGGTCLYYTCDLANKEDIYKASDLMLRDVGEPDIVVCNAGISTGVPMVDDSDALTEKAMSVNLMSNLFMVKRFWGGMQARGYGHFVFVASQGGLSTGNLYGMTKAGQILMAEGLVADARSEMIAQGGDQRKMPSIHASSYIVGFVDTPMVRNMRQLMGPMNMLSPDQAAQDIVWMLETRATHCHNPFWDSMRRSMMAHQPQVPAWIVDRVAGGMMAGYKKRKDELRREGVEVGQSMAYKLRTVDVQRRLSMFKRSGHASRGRLAVPVAPPSHTSPPLSRRAAL